MSLGVLVIEDDDTQARNIRLFLERRGYDVRTCGSGEAGLREARIFRPDAIVLDYQLPAGDGIETLRELVALDRRVKIVMVTAHGSLDIAIEAIRLGAYDYLEKPIALSALEVSLEKALGHRKLEGAVEYYRSVQAAKGGLDKIIGVSPLMADLRDQIRRLVDTELATDTMPPPNVLIEGETGVGKKLVARAIHFEGPRKQGPWITVPCAQISRDAFEAELFGYERDQIDPPAPPIGLLEAANGGTIFLDEASEIPREVQTRLRQVFDTRKVRRLGGLRDRDLDIRVIASTNRPLRKMSESGGFNVDLFHRLSEISISVPPLRSRIGDVRALADHFLEQNMHCYGRSNLSFSFEAQSAMLQYAWPGNVRELRNAIGRAALLAPGAKIKTHHLGLSHISDDEAFSEETRGFILPSEGVRLDQVESDLIAQAMARTSGNVSKAARLLGLTRDTLRYRLAKLSSNGDD